MEDDLEDDKDNRRRDEVDVEKMRRDGRPGRSCPSKWDDDNEEMLLKIDVEEIYLDETVNKIPGQAIRVVPGKRDDNDEDIEKGPLKRDGSVDKDQSSKVENC